MAKTHVALLCGGQSAEHEISIISAQKIVAALDQNKYHINIIYISKSGGWFLLPEQQLLAEDTSPAFIADQSDLQRLLLNMGNPQQPLLLQQQPEQKLSIDVFFPVLHGPNGEDGTLQGTLDILDVPYVGCGVLGSALCMDKDVCKRLLIAANIPTAQWIAVRADELTTIKPDVVVAELGLPLFVKPAHIGSSVGISKVNDVDELMAALEVGLQYDTKVILEQNISGREIECAVLGDVQPRAALPAEIICHHEFYSYEAKYLDPQGASFVVPAKLSEDMIQKIQHMAIKAFQTVECTGMTRVDFFVTADHQLYVNEMNPIPGFTDISMYPQMWQASGVAYADLLDELIRLATVKFDRQRVFKTTEFQQESSCEK